jgi:hypothetical protein
LAQHLGQGITLGEQCRTALLLRESPHPEQP